MACAVKDGWADRRRPVCGGAGRPVGAAVSEEWASFLVREAQKGVGGPQGQEKCICPFEEWMLSKVNSCRSGQRTN